MLEFDEQQELNRARQLQNTLAGMEENAAQFQSRLVRGIDGWMYDVQQTAPPFQAQADAFPSDPPTKRLPPLGTSSDSSIEHIRAACRSRIKRVQSLIETHPLVDVPIQEGQFTYLPSPSPIVENAGNTSHLTRAIPIDTWPAPFWVYPLGRKKYGVARGWMRSFNTAAPVYRAYPDTIINTDVAGVIGIRVDVHGQDDHTAPKPEDFTIKALGDIGFLPFPVNHSAFSPKVEQLTKTVPPGVPVRYFKTHEWTGFIPLAFVYPSDNHITPINYTTAPSNPDDAKSGNYGIGASVMVLFNKYLYIFFSDYTTP